MIRAADLNDIPAMVELGRRMHDESPRFRGLAYSAKKVRELCKNLITLEGGFAWVGVREGKVVAAMIGACGEHWMSTDKVASELALFVDRDARGAALAARLVTAFVSWAEIEGAKSISAGASTGIETERTAQFYERFGFSRSNCIGLERAVVCATR